MNILVQNAAGKCLMRPDTSINRENGDFYVPDDVDAVGWSPALFARISKAGKAVQPGFAARYYDSFAFGVLLHPSCETRDGKAHYCKACAAIYDNSTVIPYPLCSAETLNDTDKSFYVAKDGKEVYLCNLEGLRGRLEQAIAKCSSHSSVRIGDMVAVELAGVQDLVLRDSASCSLEARFDSSKIIDIKIIF